MLQTFKNTILHLFYPHICAGCGTDALPVHGELCLHCLHQLPITGFEKHPDNPVEKIFAGRMRIEAAGAHYYFTKASLLQQLLHQLKYRGNQPLGHQLGAELGIALKNTKRFDTVEGLIPVPLFKKRERRRGYNQALVLCKGVASVLKKPVWEGALQRIKATETQTKKNRTDRWDNVQDTFFVPDEHKLANKHLLLIDDVITTGATFEASGSVLLKIPGVRLSVAALCFATE